MQLGQLGYWQPAALKAETAFSYAVARDPGPATASSHPQASMTILPHTPDIVGWQLFAAARAEFTAAR